MKIVTSKPPLIAKWLMSFFMNHNHPETMLADYDEIYYDLTRRKGVLLAKLWYWFQIVATIPSYFNNSIYWSVAMFRNYLTIALRNIKKHKGYSFINITGLVLGMTCTILISLWELDELSYDKFHENSDRIYRVTREWLDDDGTPSLRIARVATAIGPLLKNDYGETCEEIVRINQDQPIVEYMNNRFLEERFFWAEENIFRVFSFPLIDGNPENALSEPGTVVITQSMAEKYFGDENPMNKVLNVQRVGDLKITGIMQDLPHNTHFKCDFLASFKTLNRWLPQGYLSTNWFDNYYLTYILFSENASVKEFENGLSAFIDRYLTPLFMELRGRKPAQDPSKTNILHLQKLTDIHLHSQLTNEIEPNGNISNVYIFSTIAIFVLILACINFMNLSTARSMYRAKEIGMRKVTGASRFQIVQQFLSESVLISFIALALSVIIVNILLPLFNNFVSKDLSFGFDSNSSSILLLMLIGLITGILAGSYPAFFLSAFMPASILKNVHKTTSKGKMIRPVLVVAQFAISISLLICLGIISSQMKYMKNKKLGYNKEHVVIVNASENIIQKMESFKEQLKQNPAIVSVTSSGLVPTDNLLNWNAGQTLDGENPGPISFALKRVSVDYDFLQTYEMALLTGRNFSREFVSDDSMAFILNETAVKELGWGEPENAINRPFRYGNRTGRIVGVVKDIYFESLHNEIAPTIYHLSQQENWQISTRIKSGNIPAALKYIEKTWKEYSPEGLFEYTFLDDQYNNLYQSETQLGEVLGIFSFMAILIACLGLFGLASFTAEQKTKEIGVRKVLGASVSGITFLLNKEFSRWVLIANLIAWPVAWYVMNLWLQGFAYRTHIEWVVFLISGLFALLVAMITVSYQSVKAATANPVDSLKYE